MRWSAPQHHCKCKLCLAKEQFAIAQEYSQSAAEVQDSLAVEQWVHCDVLPNVTGQELCAGQHPYSNASISLQSGILLLKGFLGNGSEIDAM